MVAGISGPELALVIVMGPVALAVHAAHTPGGMPGTGVRSAVNEPPAAGALLSGFCPPTVSVATQKGTGSGSWLTCSCVLPPPQVNVILPKRPTKAALLA